MSFNICRGTLGSLAMFTAIRNASSRVSPFRRYPALRFILKVQIGERLAVGILHDEGFQTFLDRPWPGEAARHGPQLPPYRVCSS
jgi:hypothetical protein